MQEAACAKFLSVKGCDLMHNSSQGRCDILHTALRLVVIRVRIQGVSDSVGIESDVSESGSGNFQSDGKCDSQAAAGVALRLQAEIWA